MSDDCFKVSTGGGEGCFTVETIGSELCYSIETRSFAPIEEEELPPEIDIEDAGYVHGISKVSGGYLILSATPTLSDMLLEILYDKKISGGILSVTHILRSRNTGGVAGKLSMFDNDTSTELIALKDGSNYLGYFYFNTMDFAFVKHIERSYIPL